MLFIALRAYQSGVIPNHTVAVRTLTLAQPMKWIFTLFVTVGLVKLNLAPLATNPDGVSVSSLNPAPTVKCLVRSRLHMIPEPNNHLARTDWAFTGFALHVSQIIGPRRRRKANMCDT